MIEILVYVSGIIPGYWMQKKAFLIYSDGEWTLISRGFGFFCGLLSWLGFVVSLTQWAIMKIISSDWADRPAKW